VAQGTSAESAAARNSVVDVWWMIGFMPAVGDLVRCTDGSWIRNVNLKWPRRDGSSWPRGQPGWGASGCSDLLRGPIRSAGARVLPIAAADRRRSRCASRVSGPDRCLGGRDERGRRRRDGAGHVAGHRLPKLAASARRLLNWIPGSVCRGDGRVGDGGRRG
jgi:hypothetical protein